MVYGCMEKVKVVALLLSLGIWRSSQVKGQPFENEWLTQFLPPQCNLSYLLMPMNMTYLGPRKSIQTESFGDIMYHEFGPEQDNMGVVVFLNGFGQSQLEWPLSLLARMSKEYRCVIVDYPRTVDSVQGMADAMVEFLKTRYQNQSYSLIGYSMGGSVAMEMTARDDIDILAAVSSTLHTNFVRHLLLCSRLPGGGLY